MDAELASKGQESRGESDSSRRAKSCRICDKDSCGKKNIRVYAVTSMISFLLALTMWIVALGVDVITVVEAAVARYGVPDHLHSDNGPEVIASCMSQRLRFRRDITLTISHTTEGRGGRP